LFCLLLLSFLFKRGDGGGGRNSRHTREAPIRFGSIQILSG
jgi:hypothetical protein